MKKTRAVICLTVAIVLVLYPTATAIVEHIKAETVEKGKTPSQPPALQSSRSEEMPGNISTEYTIPSEVAMPVKRATIQSLKT